MKDQFALPAHICIMIVDLGGLVSSTIWFEGVSVVFDGLCTQRARRFESLQEWDIARRGGVPVSCPVSAGLLGGIGRVERRLSTYLLQPLSN